MRDKFFWAFHSFLVEIHTRDARVLTTWRLGLGALPVAIKNPALNTTSAFGYDLERKKTYWECIKAPVEL